MIRKYFNTGLIVLFLLLLLGLLIWHWYEQRETRRRETAACIASCEVHGYEAPTVRVKYRKCFCTVQVPMPEGNEKE